MINFVLASMISLRFYLPLIKKIGGQNSRVFMLRGTKYNNPYLNRVSMDGFSKQYSFSVYDFDNINSHPAPFTFFLEGEGADSIKYPSQKISFTYCTDYTALYRKYVDSVDKIIMPSEFAAKYYGVNGPKNLYLGNPQYENIPCKEEILQKYQMKDGKKAMILYPRYHVADKINLPLLYSHLEKMGYLVILKARGKEPAPANVRPKYYVEDGSWYPHPSLELMKVSDLVINYDSTAIEECIIMRRPVINFHVKPTFPLEFLYNYPYCRQLKTVYNFEDFKRDCEFLISANLSIYFEEAIEKYLYNSSGVSDRILQNIGYEVKP